MKLFLFRYSSLSGVIPHSPAQARAPNLLIISYFQAREDALRWEPEESLNLKEQKALTGIKGE